MSVYSSVLLVKKENIKFDDLPLELWPYLIDTKIWKIQAFIHSYCNYFAFSIRDLEGYKDKPIYIQL